MGDKGGPHEDRPGRILESNKNFFGKKGFCELV